MSWIFDIINIIPQNIIHIISCILKTDIIQTHWTSDVKISCLSGMPLSKNYMKVFWLHFLFIFSIFEIWIVQLDNIFKAIIGQGKTNCQLITLLNNMLQKDFMNSLRGNMKSSSSNHNCLVFMETYFNYNLGFIRDFWSKKIFTKSNIIYIKYIIKNFLND